MTEPHDTSTTYALLSSMADKLSESHPVMAREMIEAWERRESAIERDKKLAKAIVKELDFKRWLTGGLTFIEIARVESIVADVIKRNGGAE